MNTEAIAYQSMFNSYYYVNGQRFINLKDACIYYVQRLCYQKYVSQYFKENPDEWNAPLLDELPLDQWSEITKDVDELVDSFMSQWLKANQPKQPIRYGINSILVEYGKAERYEWHRLVRVDSDFDLVELTLLFDWVGGSRGINFTRYFTRGFGFYQFEVVKTTVQKGLGFDFRIMNFESEAIKG